METKGTNAVLCGVPSRSTLSYRSISPSIRLSSRLFTLLVDLNKQKQICKHTSVIIAYSSQLPLNLPPSVLQPSRFWPSILTPRFLISIQNSAAAITFLSCCSDHVTPLVTSLHWLLIHSYILHKPCSDRVAFWSLFYINSPASPSASWHLESSHSLREDDSLRGRNPPLGTAYRNWKMK